MTFSLDHILALTHESDSSLRESDEFRHGPVILLPFSTSGEIRITPSDSHRIFHHAEFNARAFDKGAFLSAPLCDCDDPDRQGSSSALIQDGAFQHGLRSDAPSQRSLPHDVSMAFEVFLGER
jgi:hypothetical protein